LDADISNLSRLQKDVNPTGFRNELYDCFLDHLLKNCLSVNDFGMVPADDKMAIFARRAAIKMLADQKLTSQHVQWALNNVLPPAQDTTVDERAAWAEKRRAIRKKYRLLEPSRQQTPRIVCRYEKLL
jgi:hypothetical protein